MKDIVRNVRAAAKEINHGNKKTLNNLLIIIINLQYLVFLTEA